MILLNKMKRCYLIILTVFAFITNTINGQTLHFVYCSDTNDSEIGRSSEEANRFFLNNFIPQVKKNTNLNVYKYVYTGSDFQKSKLESTLSNLSTSSGDVIFFYYTGHGYNGGDNQYPTLTLGLRGDALSTRTKSLMSIYNTLKSKPHKLLVVMAEACNYEYNMRGVRGNYSGGYGNYEGSNANYKNLFAYSSGDYLMSSCKKNQKSYCPLGGLGYFTMSFRDVLEGNSSYSSWDYFLNAVASKTRIYADQYAGETQEPQWLKGQTSTTTRTTEKSVSSTSSKVSMHGTYRSYTDNAKGLKYLTENITKWGKCQNAALTTTGMGVAIYGDYGYAYTGGITQSLKDKIKELNSKKLKIVDAALTDDNKYYCIIYGRNGWFGRVPDNLKKWLNKYNDAKEEIMSVSISNDGKCAIVTDKHYWCSDSQYMDALRSAQDDYGSAQSVCLTDLGIIVCCKNGIYYKNIPSNLREKLRTLDYIPKFVKFTDSGTFFISDGVSRYTYHM